MVYDHLEYAPTHEIDPRLCYSEVEMGFSVWIRVALVIEGVVRFWRILGMPNESF